MMHARSPHVLTPTVSDRYSAWCRCAMLSVVGIYRCSLKQMPLSPERKTWYFERLKELLDNHTKIFLVQV